MVTAYLQTDLERDEAREGQPCIMAYPDPDSHGPPWTIGYGHTGREVHPGLVWTPQQCVDALEDDIELTCKGLDSAIPWWTSLPDLAQDCLVNIAFNVGVHGLLAFSTFLALCKNNNLPNAALDLRGTLWFRQVGGRGVRVATQLATLQHQE